MSDNYVCVLNVQCVLYSAQLEERIKELEGQQQSDLTPLQQEQNNDVSSQLTCMCMYMHIHVICGISTCIYMYNGCIVVHSSL